MKHTATFETVRYPGSGYAYKITWTCSCGKSSTISDSPRRALTLNVARSAHRRHVTIALAKQTPATTGWKRQHDGWDGNSNPKQVIIAPCGCQWSVDGRSLLHISSNCIGNGFKVSGHQSRGDVEAFLDSEAATAGLVRVRS